jgi:hypothetical protein
MGRLGLVALTALVGLGSGQVRAAELVAVVEAVEAGRPRVAELEPLEAGQLVPLARGERIVVGYLDSCAREVIAGPGAVRIGTSVSRLEGASLVDRRTVDCHGSPLAGIGSGDGAATRVRGVGPAVGRVGTPQHALASLRTMRDRQAPGLAPHRLPVLLLQDPAQQVVLVPLEAQGQPRRLPADKALVDLAEGSGTEPLEPGLWLARRGAAALTFIVPADAPDGRAPRSERIVAY